MTDTSAHEPDLVASIDANIGRNLKSQRERLKLSQAELARLVTDAGVQGFHQTTIARIENGQRALRAAEAVAISRVLDTSLEFLAESKRTAMLRSEVAWLRQKIAEFDQAASGLLHARRMLATELDTQFPYGPDGMTPQEVILQADIDPDLYESAESAVVAASPDERLGLAYFREVENPSPIYARRPGNEHKSRLEYLADDMREALEDGDGEHQEKA